MKLVIFDLDDTLIDFAATREVAYRRLADHLDALGLDSRAFVQACPAIDRRLFALFEQGRISRQQYRMKRFSEPLAAIGIVPQTDLVQRLNKVFMDSVNDRPLVFDDARPVLHDLRARGMRTAILTNGPSEGQRRKLDVTGLGNAVDHVAIGEEIGYSKPSPSAYYAVLRRFALVASDALMVGDSPALDYDGALQAGLAAWLLDREDRHQGGGRTSIRSLRAVLST